MWDKDAPEDRLVLIGDNIAVSWLRWCHGHGRMHGEERRTARDRFTFGQRRNEIKRFVTVDVYDARHRVVKDIILCATSVWMGGGRASKGTHARTASAPPSRV
jgi:hypothetical protein